MISAETIQQRTHDAAILRDFWKSLIEEFLPSSQQFNRWVTQYSSDVVEFAINRTSIKASKMRGDNTPMSPDHLVRYASGCMSNKLREEIEHMGELP